MSPSTSRLKRVDPEPIVDVLSVEQEMRRPLSSRSSRYSSSDISPEDEQSYDMHKSSMLTNTEAPRKGIPKNDSSATGIKSKSQMTRVGDLEIGEVDDLEEDFNDIDLGPRVLTKQVMMSVDSKPINLQTAVVSNLNECSVLNVKQV